MCLAQGDGVWLPRTSFQGAAWVTSLHRELFAEYSLWSATILEIAATAGAAKGFTEVMGFFHWKANNTGAGRCSSWEERIVCCTAIQASSLLYKLYIELAGGWAGPLLQVGLAVQVPCCYLHPLLACKVVVGSASNCCVSRAGLAGSYHGLAPTNRRSGSYGLLHFTTDKSGKVTDITIWRAGFREEREVLVSAGAPRWQPHICSARSHAALLWALQSCTGSCLVLLAVGADTQCSTPLQPQTPPRGINRPCAWADPALLLLLCPAPAPCILCFAPLSCPALPWIRPVPPPAVCRHTADVSRLPGRDHPPQGRH